MTSAWLQVLPWVVVPMMVVWGISVVRRDASVVDVFWGPGFGIAAAVYFLQAPDPGLRGALVLGAVLLWSARLGVHLGARWIRKGQEDYRYAAMRAGHGRRFWLVSLGTVFLLQAALIWVLSWPLLAGMYGAGPLGVAGWAGLALFLAGFLFESTADAQLARFRANPENRGAVLDSGLWRLSRHPNYFGEAVLWWGLWLLAADAGGWWTVFAPLCMTLLLLRVSGVPLLEPHLAETRPGYADYVRRTSGFIPWLPRRS
jgi:steroid 5-alpha reductase family enzyme